MEKNLKTDSFEELTQNEMMVLNGGGGAIVYDGPAIAPSIICIDSSSLVSGLTGVFYGIAQLSTGDSSCVQTFAEAAYDLAHVIYRKYI